MQNLLPTYPANISGEQEGEGNAYGYWNANKKNIQIWRQKSEKEACLSEQTTHMTLI